MTPSPRMSAPASDPDSTVAVVVEGTPTDTAPVAASEPTADEATESESASTTVLPGSGAGPVGGMIQTPPPGPVDDE